MPKINYAIDINGDEMVISVDGSPVTGANLAATANATEVADALYRQFLHVTEQVTIEDLRASAHEKFLAYVVNKHSVPEWVYLPEGWQEGDARPEGLTIIKKANGKRYAYASDGITKVWL